MTPPALLPNQEISLAISGLMKGLIFFATNQIPNIFVGKNTKQVGK